MTNTEQTNTDIKKGCGKVIQILSNGNKLMCGQRIFVNIRHRKPLLCPECKLKLKEVI